MCTRCRSSRSRRGSRRLSAGVVEKLKDLKARVRALPAGGDLESLIHQGAEEMKTVLAAELLRERRERAASSEAAFSPSGVSRL